MFDRPIDWVKKLDPDFNDATSFRHMRRFAQAALDENERIRASFGNTDGQQEWDAMFGPDDEQSREAIRLIDEHMARLNIPL